jgi:hypothetical protein
LLDGILFKPSNRLIEQVVCLVNKTDRDVGCDFGRAGFAEFSVGLIGEGFLKAELANVKSLLELFVERFFGAYHRVCQ